MDNETADNDANAVMSGYVKQEVHLFHGCRAKAKSESRATGLNESRANGEP